MYASVYIYIYIHTHIYMYRIASYFTEMGYCCTYYFVISFSLSVHNWHPSRSLTLLFISVFIAKPLFFSPQINYYQKLWTF